MTSKWCPHEVTNQFRIVFIVRNPLVPDGSFAMYVIAAIMYSTQVNACRARCSKPVVNAKLVIKKNAKISFFKKKRKISSLDPH
jgi:hypothetical protein